MANNGMKDQSRSSDKGGGRSFLVPPLPHSSRQSVDKENQARSPLGMTSRNRKGLGGVLGGTSSSSSSSLLTSNKSKYQSSVALPLLKRDNDSKSDPQNRNQNRKVLVPLPFAKNSTSTTSGGDALNNDKQTKPALPLPFSRRPESINSSSRRGVLRYRETMEGLFSITSDSSEEYQQLCRDIVDGHLADDAASWCRVLELASAQESNHRNKRRPSGRDLLRLHRRATLRFSLEKHRNDQSSVFQIWLSFAELLSKTGANEECRQVFGQIREHGCGAQRASLYLAIADFERHHDVQKAKEALQLGIAQKAQPEEALRRALSRIETGDSKAASSSQTKGGANLTTNRTKSTLKSTLPKLPTSLSPRSPRKRKADNETSPKRRRTENGAVEVTITTKTTTATIDVDEGKENNTSFGGADEMSLVLSDSSEHEDNDIEKSDEGRRERPIAESFNVVVSSHEAGTVGSLSDVKVAPQQSQNIPKLEENVSMKGGFKSTLTGEMEPRNTHKHTPNDRAASSKLVGAKRHQTSSPSVGTASDKPLIGASSLTKPTKATSICRDGGSALKRPPRVLSKTPRLGRSILSGKAQRVGLEHSMANDDSDSDSDNSDDSGTKNQATQSTMGETQSVTKVSKIDLGYMWAWNPEERRKSSTGSSNEKKPPTPTIEKTKDLPPLHESAYVANPQSSQLSLSLTRKSAQSTDSEVTERSDHSSHSSHASGRRGSTRSVQSPSSTAVSPTTAKIIANSNPDFLPLVSQSNILKVNSVPYVKLGVVGKGGSSKVYRALTKDCTVLAIKKVKLSGMDRKAIDGFANEIALLKRLRNNPAIIQIYDSEVDVKRKAIFVVMEAGEVDLNHVLQQQSLQSNNGSRALNMNFIRLTWYQMLSAVHSIHEERIIHGDLKPANFLFVRGALKLIDFGIAKAIQSDDTTNIYRESQIGTLNYMSPEAILDTGGGKPGSQKMKCGRASDIWSLGCILYQLTYGRTPFASLHMIQKMQAIINPNHKIDFPNTVDEGAIDAMQQCLKRKAQDRPVIVGKGGLLNEHRFLNSSRSS